MRRAAVSPRHYAPRHHTPRRKQREQLEKHRTGMRCRACHDFPMSMPEEHAGQWCRFVRTIAGITNTTLREDSMNKLIAPAVIIATGIVAAAAWSQTPPP